MITAGRDALREVPASGGETRHLLVWMLLLLAQLFAFPASAAKWDIVPALSGAATYTDNVSLAPDASKQGDWVLQAVPSISISGTGSKLRLKADYAPQITYYVRDLDDKNDIFHAGNAALNAELAEKLVFVDAGGSVGQYNISLQGPITDNNVNTTGNRATVRAFYVSPYIRHDFASKVRAEARYRYSVTDSNDPATSQDSTENSINLRLASGPAYRLLSWDVDYLRRNIRYESVLNPEIDSDVILGKARWSVTPTVGVLARLGYEFYEFNDFRPKSNGFGWGGGFDWAPSPRTALSAVAGRRFYGNAYELDIRHRTRLLALSAGYDQEVTTTRQEFFIPSTTSTIGYLDQLYSSTISDPVARKQTVESVISELGLPGSLNAPVNYFIDQLLLDKRWRASVAVRGVRNIIIVNAFKADRNAVRGDVLLPGVINENNNTQQIGTSIAWSSRITARDTWNLSAGYTRNKFPGSGRVDNLTSLQMGFSRLFQPRFRGSLSYVRHQRNSNVAFDYTENAVVGTLQITF